MARPTKIALLADRASSSGSTLRMAVEIATARSAPAHARVQVQGPGVVRPGDVAELLLHPPVVGRVDDPLLGPGAERVNARDAERETQPVGQRECGQAALHQVAGGVGEGVVLAGAVLDLARDQLTGEPLPHRLVGGRDHVLVAVGERQRRRVEDLVLLLDPDREVGRPVEALADAVEDLAARWVAIGHPGRI